MCGGAPPPSGRSGPSPGRGRGATRGGGGNSRTGPRRGPLPAQSPVRRRRPGSGRGAPSTRRAARRRETGASSSSPGDPFRRTAQSRAGRNGVRTGVRGERPLPPGAPWENSRGGGGRRATLLHATTARGTAGGEHATSPADGARGALIPFPGACGDREEVPTLRRGPPASRLNHPLRRGGEHGAAPRGRAGETPPDSSRIRVPP